SAPRFSPARVRHSGSRNHPAAWAPSAAGATPPSPSRAKASATDAKPRRSALYWLTGQTHMPSQTATLLQHAIRDPDPYFQVHDRWLIRQLAPDIAKIDMPKNQHDKRLVLAPDLLRLMGQETANIHLGSRSRRDLETRLNRLNRDRQWFSTATERMVARIRKAHAEWTSHFHDS